jgi:hypothetical protein
MGGLRRIAELSGPRSCVVERHTHRKSCLLKERDSLVSLVSTDDARLTMSRVYDRAEIITSKNEFVNIFVRTVSQPDRGVYPFLSSCSHTLLHA